MDEGTFVIHPHFQLSFKNLGLNHPRVTIVTVTYNAGPFVERTLRSVDEQGLSDIEHLIVDGLSKDQTLSIVAKYAQPWRKVVSEKDSGLYDAMNKSLKLASGDYLIFLNAGDVFFDKDSLKFALEHAADADFVYGETKVIDEAGVLGEWHKKTPSTSEMLDGKCFLHGMVICHQAMMVKRSIAPEYLYKRWKYVADLDWSIRTARNARSFVSLEKTTIKFLLGGFSDQRRRESLKERWKVLVEHFGIWSTLWAHVAIVFEFIRKKVSG